jgi:hypothetical protein
MPLGLAGDQQVVGPDRGPAGLEGRSDLAGRPGVLVSEREQLERAGEERLEAPQARLPAGALGGAVPQFEGRDRGDGDVLALLDDLLQVEADLLGVAVDDRDAGAGVQQVGHSEHRACRGGRLVAALGHERLRIAPVQLREPLGHVGDQRFEQDPAAHPPDADPVTREPELVREPDGLAAAVAEQSGDAGLRHGASPGVAG